MINVDHKVKNIYHMLCYSFDSKLLNEKNSTTLGEEAFENIYNLFSILLCTILKKQIRRGIHYEYNNISNSLNTVQGKIDINRTLKDNSLCRKKIFCQYDEYNENCLLNKVIKTTLIYLINSNKIGNKTKITLKKCVIYFKQVEVTDIKRINWNLIKYNKNNISYKYIIDMCKLILNGLIICDKNGDYNFKHFLDDKSISSIFENFVRSYYKKHYPVFKAKSNILTFNESKKNDLIPIMKTDITLNYEDRKLIIDTKFYNEILKKNCFYNSTKISNAHLYQIVTYVDNQDLSRTNKVVGMLLYAQTEKVKNISMCEILNGHCIVVRTINMNEDWINIKKDLDNIAYQFINNSFI